MLGPDKNSAHRPFAFEKKIDNNEYEPGVHARSETQFKNTRLPK